MHNQHTDPPSPPESLNSIRLVEDLREGGLPYSVADVDHTVSGHVFDLCLSFCERTAGTYS